MNIFQSKFFSLKKTLPRKVLQGARHLKPCVALKTGIDKSILVKKPFEKFKMCVVKPVRSLHSLSWTARTMSFTGEESDSLPMALPRLSAKRLHSLPFTLSTGPLLRKKKERGKSSFLSCVSFTVLSVTSTKLGQGLQLIWYLNCF